MKKARSLLILFLVSGNIMAQKGGTSELLVIVENIKKVKGSLKIAVYDSEANFLSHEFASGGKKVSGTRIEYLFHGLPAGTYAVTLFQDLNNNNELDTNFMGIPSEPYAFSNNAKGSFGPPKFEDCTFIITSRRKEIRIRL